MLTKTQEGFIMVNGLTYFIKSFVFVSIFVLVSLFIVSQGNSKITKEYDDFDKTTSHRSKFKDEGPWYTFYVIFGEKNDKIVEKSISFLLLKENWHFFAKQDMDMKIDGEIIHIPCGKTSSHAAGLNHLLTAGIYALNDKAITKIKNAEKITIRIYMSNVPSITWDVPERVLNEWKKLFGIVGI